MQKYQKVILLSITGILLSGILVYALVYALVRIAFQSDFGFDQTDQPLRNITITTRYGDIFVDAISLNVSLRVADNPESQIMHQLFWTRKMKAGISHENFIGKKTGTTAILICNNQRDTPIQISELARIEGVNYYFVANQEIVWVKNDSPHYYYIDAAIVKWLNKNECPDLLPLAKKMVASGSWKWYHVFALYLINNADDEITKMTKRYANNQFTSQELAANVESGYQRTEIVNYSKDLLSNSK